MLRHEKLDKLVIQFEKPALTLGDNVETMDPSDMGEFCGYIFSQMEKSGINYILEVSFPLCLIKEDILEEMLRKGRVVTCCHAQKGTGIVFDVTGEVVPCNHFMGYPFDDNALNPADPEAIEKLMELDTVQWFKETANKYPTSKCQTCDRWPICGGGCFTRWLYLNPNNYIRKEV